MAQSKGKGEGGAAARRTTRRGTARTHYSVLEGGRAGETPRKKNLRLHQSKIDEARMILGTSTETETIEAALDLVVFRNELLQGVRAMRGVELVNLFDEEG